MIVFINSICNLTCEHCFYWKELNQRNDLTFEEFEKLSLELGALALRQMIEAGASRIGASAGVEILNEAETKSQQ